MDYWEENNIVKPQQVVVCAACRKDDVIVAGARHYDKVMRSQLKAMNEPTPVEWEEGFIDQFGDFLTREEAMEIAQAAGQKVDVERGCGGQQNTLYSEGLY